MTSEKTTISGEKVTLMNPEQHIYKMLSDIYNRQGSVEKTQTEILAKLTEVVRLEERITGHENDLKRHGKQLSEHSTKIEEIRYNQARNQNSDLMDEKLKNINTALDSMRQDIKTLEADSEQLYKEIHTQSSQHHERLLNLENAYLDVKKDIGELTKTLDSINVNVTTNRGRDSVLKAALDWGLKILAGVLIAVLIGGQ